MRRLIMATTAALAVLLIGCGSPAAPPGTGIQGTVVIGPMCPVERADQPCPPRPIRAVVVVQTPSGQEVTRFQSGPDGRFKVNLAPGSYVLLGTTSTGGLPRPIPTPVTVSSGTYTTVTVEYDSGIR